MRHILFDASHVTASCRLLAHHSNVFLSFFEKCIISQGRKEREKGEGRKEKGDRRRETGDRRPEKGEGRREKAEGRRQKGEGRREKGEGGREIGEGRIGRRKNGAIV